MSTSACHHLALRVTDIDASVRFYQEAFGAEVLTRPFTVEGELADRIFPNAAPSTFKMCHLGFDGGGIELFQLVTPAPMGELDTSSEHLIHWCLQVDDVEAAVRRVEAAGGRALFEITKWGPHDFVYCADPDGNIVELIAAPLQDLVALSIESFPEAAP